MCDSSRSWRRRRCTWTVSERRWGRASALRRRRLLHLLLTAPPSPPATMQVASLKRQVEVETRLAADLMAPATENARLKQQLHDQGQQLAPLQRELLVAESGLKEAVVEADLVLRLFLGPPPR